MDTILNEKGRFNNRMSDKEEIPEMNGTIHKLVELLSSPLDTPEQQANAIKDSIKLQLHTYIIQKQIYTLLNSLSEERHSILSKIVDKGVIPLIYAVVTAILYMVAEFYLK